MKITNAELAAPYMGASTAASPELPEHDAIYVGEGGTLNFVDKEDTATDKQLTGIPNGSILNVQALKISTGNTTAGNIVLLTGKNLSRSIESDQAFAIVRDAINTSQLTPTAANSGDLLQVIEYTMTGQQNASSVVHYPNSSDGSNSRDIVAPQLTTAVNHAVSYNIFLYPGIAWLNSLYDTLNLIDVSQYLSSDIYRLFEPGTTNSALVGATAMIVWNEYRVGVRVSSSTDYANPTSPTGPWKIVWSNSLGIGTLTSAGGALSGAKMRVNTSWATGDNAQTPIPSKTGSGSILQIGIFKD